MGAAASLVEAGLPEKLTRAEAQQLCANKYTEELFNSLSDEEGHITAKQFIEQVVLEQEEECKRLFHSFCRHESDGTCTEEMDEESLLSFMRHCKLLSKSGFSIHDAKELFHKLIQEKVDADDKTKVHVVDEMNSEGGTRKHVYINYTMFREGILPELASKKNVDMDKIMFLLSRCEPSTRLEGGEYVVTDEYNPLTDGGMSVERNIKLLVKEKEIEEKEKERKSSKTESPEEIKRNVASKKIQGAARRRTAKRQKERFRQIRQESLQSIDENSFCNETYEDVEPKLQAKFEKFASPRSHEMDYKQFHKWLVSCGWFITNKNFSARDAEAAFKKSMARASVLSAGIDLNLGVIMNKRVRYNVFRKSTVKLLAEEINVQTNEVMYILLEADDEDGTC